MHGGMSKKYSHIILDLDGTLIEETESLVTQVRAVSHMFGASPEAIQAAIYAFFAANDRAVAEGGVNKNNITQYMMWMGEELGKSVDKKQAIELAKLWQAAYQVCAKAPVLFFDAVSFLETVAERGYTLVLASGGTEVEKRARLDAAGIDHYFERVFAATDMGYQKQDQRFWKTMLAELDVPPEQIMVIGNQINDDVWKSGEVGMYTVLVRRLDAFQKVRDPEGVTADREIQSLVEILSEL